MKKFILVFLLVFLINFISIKAATLSDYLPGGKNYLDQNNFELSNNSLSTINEFLVKSGTVYTLSFPGFDRLGEDIIVEINGLEMYIDGNVLNEYNCTVDDQVTVCTFQTEPSEDYISVMIASNYLEHYVESYGFFGFQLEEGSSPTSYEEYIVSLADITDPEFSGVGGYIKSYHTFESINTIINNHIYVVDEVDGDISSSIVIESDTYTGNEQVVGEYVVHLSASDLSGNTAYFSLNILVKDEIDPVITGPNEIEISVSSTMDINTVILDNFDVYDEYGSVSLNILEDNYTPNIGALGMYFVTFEVIDESLNATSKIFSISITDTDAPVITSNLNISSYLSNPYNIGSVLDTLEFNDNFDDMANIDVVILDDRFSGNESVPGIYSINFEATDQSSNMVEGSFTITVIDDVSPEIIGPVTYQGSYEEDLTVNDFLNMLDVSDNISLLGLSDIIVIEDDYTDRVNITGDFVITFEVTDEYNNSTTHSITVTLIDDVAPVVYIDNYIVTVNVASTFTNEDALTLLINSNELVEGSYEMRTLFDGYSGNENNEGTYIYLIEFTNELGERFEKEFLVNVIEGNTSSVDKGLLVRNIIIYSITISIFGVVIVKNKKV